MLSTKILGALSATAMTIVMACASQASAATVTFSSDGSWGASNCSTGCSLSGNTFKIGNNTNPFLPDSTLTANDFSSSFSTDAVAQRIGQITWVNSPTNQTDTSFSLAYQLALTFTAPNAAADVANFTFLVTQPTNPPGDTVGNMNVGLPTVGPIVLTGVTISNIHWVLAPSSAGSFSNGNWYNPENSTSTLQLVADFKATPVPEPASLALLGMGLIGFAAAKRRRLN